MKLASALLALALVMAGCGEPQGEVRCHVHEGWTGDYYRCADETGRWHPASDLPPSWE